VIVLTVGAGIILTVVHDTEKLTPVMIQPDEFLTEMVWLPLAIPVKLVEDTKFPPSILYSRPVPRGLTTDIAALPDPCEQSIDCKGIAGKTGWSLIFTPADGSDVDPVASVTVKKYVPGNNPVMVMLVP
jgi:hypothetical protein